MKNRDSTKAAIEQVENESCIVFHSCEVDKFKGEKEKFDRRLLLLTNISVIFFKISSKPKQLCCEYWADLVGVDGLLGQGQTITLFFKEDIYKFRIDDFQEIKCIKLKLGDLFQRIFTPEEQEMRGLNKSDLYQISCRSIQNSFGQYSRFISYAKSNNIEIEKETEKRFFTYLVYHQNEISFPKKIRANEFESFMYGLDALTFVESIIFSNISNIDIFQQLNTFYSTLFEDPSKYIKNGRSKETPSDYQFSIRENIRHLCFKKIKMTKNFDEFLRRLDSGQIKHNLTGLSFDNMKLIENDFYMIDKLVRSINSNQGNNKLKSLSFNASLNEDQFNYFISSFLNNDTTRYLMMLSLNKTFNLTLPLLFDKIRNITSLSLADCDINILSTLQCINRTKMDNLRLLNLSGNYCSKSLPQRFELNRNRKKKRNPNINGECYNPDDDVEFRSDDIVFPQSLAVLYVRNVRWGLRYKSLIALLQAASSFRPKNKDGGYGGFHLSIRGIKGGSFQQTDNESNCFNNSLNYYNELNSYLAGFYTNLKKSYLVHLDWAGNPISSDFINFLSKSKRLIELDVSYCFSAELEEEEGTNGKLKQNSLIKQFSKYLINDAKNLKSLIICGNTRPLNEDNSKKKSDTENIRLSQNLSGHSIYPLFEAIKKTNNPLSYINISGQRLDNPEGLNLFSEAIEANLNIQKVSFKNTGFETKDQFNYFVSKVKRKTKIVVEWPAEEMKNIHDANISHCKKLLIHLSKEKFYYETVNRDISKTSEKVDKKKKKNRDNSDSSQSEDEDFPIIRYDKLLFGKNYMARNIEIFNFDTDRDFPLYVSKEVEDFLSLTPGEDNEDSRSDESPKKKKKQTQKKKKNSEESEVKSEVENNTKRKEEEKEKQKKKSNKNEKKSIKKTEKERKSKTSDDDDDKSDTTDDTDDEDDILDHKKHYLISKSDKRKNDSDSDSSTEEERQKSRKKTNKRNVSVSSDSNSDTEEEKPLKKTKIKKRSVSVTSKSESESDSEVRKPKKRQPTSSDDNDDESDNVESKEWKFPSGIKPKESNEKAVKKIKEKFSLENLMTALVNGSE